MFPASKDFTEQPSQPLCTLWNTETTSRMLMQKLKAASNTTQIKGAALALEQRKEGLYSEVCSNMFTVFTRFVQLWNFRNI